MLPLTPCYNIYEQLEVKASVLSIQSRVTKRHSVLKKNNTNGLRMVALLTNGNIDKKKREMIRCEDIVGAFTAKLLIQNHHKLISIQL